MRIVSESVVDREGKVIGDDPSKFPIITNRCLKLSTSLKTGQDYTIEYKEVTA